MKTKHTREKWKVESCNVRTTIVSDETPVCNLFNLGEETEANAKLIEAAPELLEALEMAVNILECKHGFHKKFDNPRSIEEMKSAIAKATNQKIEG